MVVPIIITEDFDWKWKLSDQSQKYAQYLIHPDGSLHRTEEIKQ